jgi:hypothetical protein
MSIEYGLPFLQNSPKIMSEPRLRDLGVIGESLVGYILGDARRFLCRIGAVFGLDPSGLCRCTSILSYMCFM